MVAGPVRFLESARTIHANGEQAIGETRAALAFYAFEPLPDSLGDRSRHALSGELGQFRHQSMRFRALYIQSHPYTLLPVFYTMGSIEASSFVNAAPLLVRMRSQCHAGAAASPVSRTLNKETRST